MKGRPNSTLGASEAAIVSGKAANEILAREIRISIEASPLTIVALLRKENPLAARVVYLTVQ